MSKIINRSGCIIPVLIGLTGCVVVPPSPPGGAPVVDRSLRPQPETRPTPVAPAQPYTPPVEVRPLSRPEPIQPEGYPQQRYPQQPVARAPVQPTSPPQPTPPPNPTQPVPAQPAQPAQPSPPVSPAQPANPPPAEISREGNPPVVALLDSAAGHVSSGEWDKAAASLERALRIEPRNAGIWHDLAQIRLQQRQYQQAESLAAKSNSLAGGNKNIRVRNWRLIAVSRRAAGNAAGADAAEAQATLLER